MCLSPFGFLCESLQVVNAATGWHPRGSRRKKWFFFLPWKKRTLFCDVGYNRRLAHVVLSRKANTILMDDDGGAIAWAPRRPPIRRGKTRRSVKTRRVRSAPKKLDVKILNRNPPYILMPSIFLVEYNEYIIISFIYRSYFLFL